MPSISLWDQYLTKMTLKRREILKAAILGSSAIALSPSEINQAKTKTAGKIADVIIIGAGNTGLPAAIEASDLGSKVILLSLIHI